MPDEKSLFARNRLLLGEEKAERIAGSKVIVFGVGGVGSWCAESLVRSGIRDLTIVDSDNVAASNINRQLPATIRTIGMPKVDVLKSRFLEINPFANIIALNKLYSFENASSFNIQDYDYVVDAIDSLSHKAHLILNVTEIGVPLFSSMGAALKIDPQKVKVAEFWKVYGCPLARALRKKFKQNKQYPAKKFQCVYSPELLTNAGETDGNDLSSENFVKPVTNGTMAHVTAIFGFTLAGLIVQDIVSKL